jgi:cytochrome b subunit of formate dehydrogenase
MKKGGVKLSLFIDAKATAKSAHRTLDCLDCHEKFDGDATPHRKPIVAVDCMSCHEKLGQSHGFHRRLALDPVPTGDDTACAACHGKHDIVGRRSPLFTFASSVQAQACGRCHEPARDHFLGSAHGRAFTTHAASAPDCLTCHRQPIATRPTENITLAQKLAQTRQCESCHVGRDNVAGQALRGTKFVAAFDQSVHGAALHGGNADAANCVDCHGAHEMNRAMATGARTSKQQVAATCAQCHRQPGLEFGDSVHAVALRKGNVDSASCTDCHGEHDIRARRDPLSPVNEKNVTQEVCANCHASLKLTRKYGIASHTFQTFADSYHGLALRGGSIEVVNCASCHSSHAIKSQSDATSTIHPANLARTCGQCHPRANARFAVGRVHVSPEAARGQAGSDPLLHLIASLYVVLIVGVIGGMTVHNALDFIRKICRKLALQQGLVAEAPIAHRLYLRMSRHERLQHAVLVLSFGALLVTGFMLRYPEAWWVVVIRDASARAFEWRSLLHRLAGVVLLAAGAWHLWYLMATARGRELFRDLLPRRRDFTDPFGVLRYNLGLAPTKPAFGRFSYVEKTEYWAMVWGTLLMGATGVVLWFENTSMGLFTKLGLDISRTIHFYEAILATLAIVVWHFYFVIFNPDVYPMNLAWLTGRMSEREMHDEHPAELARLQAAESGPPAALDRPSRETKM